MLRYSTLGGLVVGAAVVGIPASNVRWAPHPKDAFYFANDGDDDNSGRSSDSPWQTIGKLNAALTDGTVERGDTVIFRCGDEFFGNISAIPAADRVGKRLTLTAYGSGDKPKISAYKVLMNADAWEEHDPGIWRIDLTDNTKFDGNVGNESANTGFLRVDGTIHGAKKWQLDDLAEVWDFYNDDQFLYVRSEQNPASAGKDIRAAVDGNIITGQTGLHVNGLDLVGSGGHGYRQTQVTDTEVSDCRVHEIGGCQLEGTTRFGNGVEMWIGSSDALVRHNEIFDVYDVAVTMQGPQEGTARGISHCRVESNKIWNCTQSFEYWGTGNDVGAGAGFVGCTFTDNVCVNGGRSWSYPVRADKVGKGNFVMAYSQELPVDITVKRNVFFDAVDCYAFVNTNQSRFVSGFDSDDNTIALRPGTRVQAQKDYTIEDSAKWVADTGLEVNSRWVVVPDIIVSPGDSLTYVAANIDALRSR